MRIGVVFPQTEIGSDRVVIKDYAQTAEELGYSHILAYDHVIGANLASRPGWQPPYSHLDTFHEPLVLYGYLAGLTKTIELTTGIIILPQRQTVLVAKQAATVDVLSGGRLRFGIGIGWNPVEYEALGQDFKNRGQRSEEQVELLRQLWTRELVTFQRSMAYGHRRRHQSIAHPAPDPDLVRGHRRPRASAPRETRRRLVSTHESR